MITQMIAPEVDDLVTIDVSWGQERACVRGPVVAMVGSSVTISIPEGLDQVDLGPGDDVVMEWHHGRGPASVRARVRSLRHGGTTLVLELSDANMDRRHRARGDVAWECRWRTAEQQGAGRLVDLGIGGARISFDGQSPPLGARVELATATPAGVIELRGRVVSSWADERTNDSQVRVRFEDLALEELLALGEFVRTPA